MSSLLLLLLLILGYHWQSFPVSHDKAASSHNGSVCIVVVLSIRIIVFGVCIIIIYLYYGYCWSLLSLLFVVVNVE